MLLLGSGLPSVCSVLLRTMMPPSRAVWHSVQFVSGWRSPGVYSVVYSFGVWFMKPLTRFCFVSKRHFWECLQEQQQLVGNRPQRQTSVREVEGQGGTVMGVLQTSFFC